MAKKKKYYVVWEGVETGIFDSWDKCQKIIKGVKGAKYKAFDSEAEARNAFAQGYWQVINATKKTSKPKPSPTPGAPTFIADSLAVDAACSGNPGVMEYQGVRTSDKVQLFHKKFPVGTNNIGEFLAIVHALAWMKQKRVAYPVYSDSVNAQKWIREKKCKTKLQPNDKNEYLFELIARAEKWLNENAIEVPILKWKTEIWGEIPADFGRK